MDTSIETLDPGAVRDLLLRNWMTHDSMWFGQAVTHHGIDDANVMNRAAVRPMAVVEAKRIRRLLAIDQVGDAGTLRRFFDAAIELVIPDIMAYELEWGPDDRSVRFHVTNCFAHDGVAALGLIDRYQCGIFERIYGWLDGLGVEYRVEPETVRCLQHTEGNCVRELRFDLPGIEA